MSYWGRRPHLDPGFFNPGHWTGLVRVSGRVPDPIVGRREGASTGYARRAIQWAPGGALWGCAFNLGLSTPPVKSQPGVETCRGVTDHL